MKRVSFGLFFLILTVTAVSQASADDLYAQFQPKQTSRIRESTEWSMTYSYGVTNSSLPRVLVIGDSICNAYQATLGPKLNGKANVTYWASSKCVTDPDYFRELNLILGANNYAFISFNNGLHSLEGTNPGEWEAAYFAAVKFIRAKCPGAKLSLATSTPIANEKRNETVKRLNAIVQKVAEDESLAVIDLYEVSEKIDKKKRWRDGVHFDKPGIDAQAEAINAAARKALNIK